MTTRQEAIERRIRCRELYDKGYTYRDIAHIMGFRSPASAYQYVNNEPKAYKLPNKNELPIIGEIKDGKIINY